MSDLHENLIRQDKKLCDDPCTAIILEQYKAYVQTADNVSARRVSASRYLLTLSAALVAVYGFQPLLLGQWYWTIPVLVIGVAVSWLWYKIIKSHRDLNDAKFQLIHELERHLPAELFRQEWSLTEKSRNKPYTKVTDIERWIPLLFAAIHAIMFIVAIWTMA